MLQLQQKIKNVDIDKNYVFMNFIFDKNYLDIEFKEKLSVIRRIMNDFSDGIMKQIRLKKSLVYSGGFSDWSDDKNMYVTIISNSR